jgi:hypothetical protein
MAGLGEEAVQAPALPLLEEVSVQPTVELLAMGALEVQQAQAVVAVAVDCVHAIKMTTLRLI